MKIDETFSIPCPQCGGASFHLPEPLEDDSFVKCNQCGFEVMLCDLKEHGLLSILQNWGHRYHFLIANRGGGTAYNHPSSLP